MIWDDTIFFLIFFFFWGGVDGPAYTKSTLAGNLKASDPDDTSLQRYAAHIAAWIAAALPDSVKSLAVKLLVRYLAKLKLKKQSCCWAHLTLWSTESTKSS